MSHWNFLSENQGTTVDFFCSSDGMMPQWNMPAVRHANSTIRAFNSSMLISSQQRSSLVTFSGQVGLKFGLELTSISTSVPAKQREWISRSTCSVATASLGWSRHAGSCPQKKQNKTKRGVCLEAKDCQLVYRRFLEMISWQFSWVSPTLRTQNIIHIRDA